MNSKKPDQATQENIGKQFKTAREKLGLTQADVAKQSKMSVNYYAMVERGEVNLSLKKMKALSTVLKVKLTIS